MKRNFLLLLFVIMTLCGCSIQRVDNYDFSYLLNKIISFDIDIHNKVSNGYEYYLPKGVIKTDSKLYNDTLKRGDNLYYLYADVVSYYYKTDVSYKVNKNAYFSLPIENGDKKGYLEITKSNDKLYVQMFYNYAKIETYVKEDDIKQTITDLSYILSSIKYNDSLLKNDYSQGNIASKEEVYKLFEDKQKKGNFLEYIKEYDKYDKKSKTKVENNTTTTTTTASETSAAN